MKKIFVLLFGLISVTALFSGIYKGVEMKDEISVEKYKLILNGQALRKKVFFKVYVAGLYLPEKQKSCSSITEGSKPWRVVLHFLRTVGAGKMSGAMNDGIKDNVKDYTPELKRKVAIFLKSMEKVRDGERMVFTFLPENGTVVEVKGEKKVVIKGRDFSDALLRCFIGPRPGPGESFKRALLGIDD